MSELVEARDFNGELYISATNLVEALQRARESGAEHERIRLSSMMTPYERKILRVREVCAECGVSFNDVMSRNKLPNVAHARQRLFLEFREMGMSLSDIGRFFGRDHTTVIHGINAEKERRDARNREQEIRQAVEAAIVGCADELSETDGRAGGSDTRVEDAGCCDLAHGKGVSQDDTARD